MSIESDKDRRSEASISLQALLGFVIGLSGGGLRLYAERLMDQNTELPIDIGQVHLTLSQSDMIWVSDAVVVFGALLFFTSPRRS